MVQSILPVLQLVSQIAILLGMIYGFYKFINKPHDTLETRVTALEIELKDTKASLLQGNDRFRRHEKLFKKQRKTNAAFKSIILAFVNFEIAYCQHTNYEFTSEIVKAKTEIEELLTGADEYDEEDEQC